MSRDAINGLVLKTVFVLMGTLAVTDTALGASVDRPTFKIEPKAEIAVVASEPGRTELHIASNAAFTLVMSDTVGDVRTELSAEMGANAQVPGPASACTWVAGMETPIYAASRKTAKAPGTPSSQAVRLVVHHSEHATPTFRAKAGPKAGTVAGALPLCG